MTLILGLVLWGIVTCAVAVGLTHWVTQKKQEHQARAYREILIEKGIEPRPEESIGQALKRAKRSERNLSIPPPSPERPLPIFARALQRPKSRASWTSEARDTEHVGGHSLESLPPGSRGRVR